MQDFSIRRKTEHSVVLLKRFKAESQKRDPSLKCSVSQCVRLPAVLSGDAGKTFLINTHERQIEDERMRERMRHREKQREREREDSERKTVAGKMRSKVIKLNYYQS